MPVIVVTPDTESVEVYGHRWTAQAVSVNATVAVKSGIIEIGGEHYTGSYEFTPTSEVQTIPVYGLSMEHDIIIDPIPNNYGLITWDGSTITVS